MSDQFDAWLEDQLADGRRRFGLRIAPALAGRRRKRWALALPGALSAKALAGFGVAALAAGGGAAVATHGGATAFGQSVSDWAAACAQAASVGDCVSDFVLGANHGAQMRSSHAQPDATTHGASQTAPHASATGTSNSAGGVAGGAPGAHPTGKPTSKGGKP